MTTSFRGVECSDQPLDISFHPSRPSILAAALVDGTVEVHDFSELLNNDSKEKDDDDDEIDTILSSTHAHQQLLPSSSSGGSKVASARCLVFAADGSALYSGGAAGDIVRLDGERISSFTTDQKSSISWSIHNASTNSSPLQVIKEFPDPNLIAAGDEAGGVRIFDIRMAASSTSNGNKSRPTECVLAWKEHDDYISALEFSADGHTLLSCSADCTLGVYDVRMNRSAITEKERFLRRSDDQEDELLSMKIIKGGRKVVCGTGEGVLCVWSWGTWGDVSDRFPGHPSSIDALLKLDEDTLLTGSSDGLIRVVSIHPDKLLGVLGDHEGFPIEKLQMNADRSHVASVSHDAIVRLWDARILQDDDDEDSKEEDEAEEDVKIKAVNPSASVAEAGQGSDDEWADMDEENSSDSDDSDSDDSDPRKSKADSRSKRLKTDAEKFFEDL